MFELQCRCISVEHWGILVFSLCCWYLFPACFERMHELLGGANSSQLWFGKLFALFSWHLHGKHWRGDVEQLRDLRGGHLLRRGLKCMFELRRRRIPSQRGVIKLL